MGPFTNKNVSSYWRKKSKSLLQLEASIFGNAKVEPMMHELNNSTNDDA
jgi:hypothetical protein